MARNYDHPVVVTDNDVTRVDGDATASNRDVCVHCMVMEQIERSACACAEHLKWKSRDGRAIADKPVRHQPCRSALHEPSGQNLSTGRRPRFPTAIDHHDGT